MSEARAAAGWYAQPDGTERFWTGEVWSDQVRPRPAPTPLPPPPPPTRGVVVPAPPNQWGVTGPLPAPQLAYTQQGYRTVTQVAPKSPGLALLGSFFFPGLGQLINGQVGKGIGMFLAYLLSLALIFAFFLGLLLVPVVWVWSMVDAYSGAKQWNARHGILS